MAVFYKYQYTNKRKNIHPLGPSSNKSLKKKTKPVRIHLHEINIAKGTTDSGVNSFNF